MTNNKVFHKIRTIILIASCTMTFSLACAQRGLIKSIDQIEVIGGASAVYLYGYEEAKQQRQLKIAFSGGLEYEFIVNEKLSIVARTLYELKGSKGNFAVNYYDENNNLHQGTVEYTHNFNYFTLPLFVRYIIKTTGLSLEAGGFIAYLIKEKTVVERLYNNSTRVSNGTENFKRFDSGINLGIRYSLPAEKIPLSFVLSSNVGLVNISELDPSMFTLYPVKTTSFTFLLSYQIF